MTIISGDDLPGDHDWLVIYPATGGRIVLARDQGLADLLNDSHARMVREGRLFKGQVLQS